MKVLLVEDDKHLGKNYKEALEKIAGYQVTHIEDGEDAFNDILINDYDVFLLDINLPKIDGLKLIKTIRLKNENAIIIMITASSDVKAMEEAYGISIFEEESEGENTKKIKLRGCDDYLKKPVKVEEIMLKIKHHVKMRKQKTVHTEPQRNKIEVDNMEFYFDTMDLYIDGVIASLRKKEKRLLSILLKNIGKTVKKEDIVSYVWENEQRKEYPLRQLVSELKNKLPKDYIKTEVGTGYRFDKI